MANWLRRVVDWFMPLRPKVPLDGMKAHDEGFELSDNPYWRYTPDHSIWRDGWLFSAGRFR